MAIVYVSPGLATGGNNGTTPADAFQSWAAFASAGCAAGSDVRVNNAEASVNAVTLTSNINGSVAAGFTTITGYSTDWTTPLLRKRNGTGAGANIDGFILNGLSLVKFEYIGAEYYTRDGMRSVTTNVNNIIIGNGCQFDNNGASGINCTISPYIYALISGVRCNNNVTGISARGNSTIERCEIDNNTTGISCSNIANVLIIHNIIHHNTTGITSTGTHSMIIDNVIDANTTGISQVYVTGGPTTFMQNRITNNTGAGIAWGTAAVIEFGMDNHFYNNAADHTGDNGLYVPNTNVSDSTDPYENQAAGNYNNAQTASIYINLKYIGITTTNYMNRQAGLVRPLDYPAVAKVMADDTVDGVTGTLALANVLVAAGGTFDEAARNTDPGVANVKLDTAYKIQNVSLVGTMSSGSLTVPATPTGLAVTNISSTKQRISWNMVAVTGGPAATYELSSNGSTADIATGIVDLDYDRSGLTANTAYTYYVRARNDAGASAWSAAVSGTTNQSLPCLTRIETATKNLVAGLATTDGYWFSWGTANDRDLARATIGASIPAAWIDLTPIEDNLDGEDSADSWAYTNRIRLIVTCAVRHASATSNPKEEYKADCAKMLEDLKRAFGNNLSTGVNEIAFFNEIEHCKYVRSEIVWMDAAADNFVPGHLRTEWDLTYTQLRQTPSTTQY